MDFTNRQNGLIRIDQILLQEFHSDLTGAQFTKGAKKSSKTFPTDPSYQIQKFSDHISQKYDVICPCFLVFMVVGVVLCLFDIAAGISDYRCGNKTKPKSAGSEPKCITELNMATLDTPSVDLVPIKLSDL